MTGGIELVWPENACPDRRQIGEFLAAIGSTGTSTITVLGERRGDLWILEIHAAGASFSRTAEAAGGCEEQAAIIAAIVATYTSLEPIAPVITSTAVMTSTVVVTSTAPGEPRFEVVREPPIAVIRSFWIVASLIAALGDVGAGAGVELSGGYVVAPIGVVLRLSARLPRTAELPAGVARLDNFALLALGAYELEPRFRLEAGLGFDLAWARSSGLALPGEAVRASPVLAAGGVYRPFGTASLEIALRAGISTIPHSFLIDDQIAISRPLFEMTAGIGGGFDL